MFMHPETGLSRISFLFTHRTQSTFANGTSSESAKISGRISDWAREKPRVVARRMQRLLEEDQDTVARRIPV